MLPLVTWAALVATLRSLSVLTTYRGKDISHCEEDNTQAKNMSKEVVGSNPSAAKLFFLVYLHQPFAVEFVH